MPGRLACRKEGRLREAQRPERARALADEARVRAPHSARWLRAARARRRRLAGLALLALPPPVPHCCCVRAARANGCAEPLARPEAAATGAQEPRRPRALGARRDALGASTSNFSPIGLPGARAREGGASERVGFASVSAVARVEELVWSTIGSQPTMS